MTTTETGAMPAAPAAPRPRFAPAPAPAPADPDARRSSLILWTVLIAMFMAVLDVSIVNVALPTIHADLHSDGAGLELSVSGYTVSYAVLIVTGARLGDLWGHARVFRGGLVVFTLCSLLCGLAPDTGALIAFRVLQGVGAAAMVPQVLSIIQRTFPGAARIKAMSMFTAVVAGGSAVGQVLGGLLVSADLFHTTWRPAFLINVPVGVVLFLLSRRVLRHDGGEPGRGLDPAGVAVLTRPSWPWSCRWCSATTRAGRCGAGCCSRRGPAESSCSRSWSTGSRCAAARP